MIYIVSGFMRSHTTMMMHCLEAGGLNPVWDSERDNWAAQNGLEVNPSNEMREITDTTLAMFAENPSQYDGRLIKLICKYGYLRLPPWQYKVVVMTRNPEEIRQSFFRVFDKPLAYTHDNGSQIPFTNEIYRHIMGGLASDLTNAGIEFEVIGGDVIQNKPRKAFDYLACRGWPIDPAKAASVVRSEHRHIRTMVAN